MKRFLWEELRFSLRALCAGSDDEVVPEAEELRDEMPEDPENHQRREDRFHLEFMTWSKLRWTVANSDPQTSFDGVAIARLISQTIKEPHAHVVFRCIHPQDVIPEGWTDQNIQPVLYRGKALVSRADDVVGAMDN